MPSAQPMTVDVCLNNMAEVVFAGPLHCRVILSPFSLCTRWKEVPIHRPYLKSDWEIIRRLLKGKVSTEIV